MSSCSNAHERIVDYKGVLTSKCNLESVMISDSVIQEMK